MAHPDGVEFSPFSDPDGSYHDSRFSIPELATLKSLAELAAYPDEALEPLVPAETTESAISWFVDKLIDQMIAEGGGNDLDSLKRGAGKIILTYNRTGAWWFMRDIKKYFKLKIQQRFNLEISDLSELDIKVYSIKVSTSSGYRELGEVIRKKWPTDPSVFQGKIVYSLDDIGDRGRTQKAIKEELLTAGALKVITVNLVEKHVPGEVTKANPDAAKIFYPDIFLLWAEYYFLIGRGLDSGTTDYYREGKYRASNTIAVLHNTNEIPDNNAFLGSREKPVELAAQT